MASDGGRRLAIWGAGGHGRVVAELARSAGWTVVGFADGDAAKRGQVVDREGAKVLWNEAELLAAARSQQPPFDAAALGIGDNRARLHACGELGELVPLPALVHPRAVVSGSAQLGLGSVVLANAVLNAGARLGVAVIVNTAGIVEHDCIIGDGSHVSPNATLAGGVQLGELAWVGAGAVVIQSLQIGRASIVGAGAVVIRDVPEGVTVVGCPARQLLEPPS